MKNRIFIYLTFIIGLYNCTSSPTPTNQAPSQKYAAKDTLIGPANADASTFVVINNITVYQYPEYHIIVSSEEQDDGSYSERITAVNMRTSDSTLVSNISFGFFAGISGNYLFVDEGTLDISRTMHIYDLTSNQKIGAFGFDSNEMKIEGTQIHYFALLDDAAAAALNPKPDCPDAKKILDAGMGLGYLEQYIFDFKTKQTTSTKIYKCQALS